MKFIEKPFLESKNTERGLYCEQIVIKYFQKQGYRLIQHRAQTPFAEVDILMQDPLDCLVLIEVKSVKSFEFLSRSLGVKQKKRLLKTLEYFVAQSKKARLEFMAVNQANEVLSLPEVFL